MYATSGINLAGYQMGIPLTADTDWKHFDNYANDAYGSEYSDFEDLDPNVISRPRSAIVYRRNCETLGRDMPYLVPKAIACGRHRLLDEPVAGLLSAMEEMPGTGFHTLVCVHARGINNVSIDGDCDGYDATVNLEIPVELVLKDSRGFIYSVKSTLPGMTLGIPLSFKLSLLTEGGAFLYVKEKIRLCGPVDAVSTNTTVMLNILIEGCIVRFMPYGISSYMASRLGQPYL